MENLELNEQEKVELEKRGFFVKNSPLGFFYLISAYIFRATYF